MENNARIAMAVAGGYLLGRTKKAKLALGLGLWLTGKKIALDPRQLPQQLGRLPVLNGLTEQVRGELLQAGKQAAGQAFTARADRWADALSRRTEELRDTGGGKPQDDTYQERAEDTEAAEPEEKPAPRRRRSTPGASGQGTARTAARSTGRTAGRAAKKTTGTARRAAGTATAATRSRRKPAERGEDDG